MRNAITLVLVFLSQAGWAQDWEDRHAFNENGASTTLRIISSTDTALFAPLIEAFIASNPDVAIEYLVTGTADIDRRLRETPEEFDIVVSSAMDLQLKLTNDGYALPIEDIRYPPWAEWRSESQQSGRITARVPQMDRRQSMLHPLQTIRWLYPVVSRRHAQCATGTRRTK